MCLPSDADNVFTILSARTLNPDLYIVSRCNAVESEHKLRMAGANQVINPYRITGSRMAAQLLHPGAVEFLDVVMRQGELELRIEEIVIGSDSSLDGQTLGEAHVRANTGVNVLAVRRADGKPPSPICTPSSCCTRERRSDRPGHGGAVGGARRPGQGEAKSLHIPGEH